MASEAAKKSEAKQHKSGVLDLIRSANAKNNIVGRLPRGIDRERFFLSLMSCIQRSAANSDPGKSLLDCEPTSVLLAAYEAAELGCNLSPSLQLGWLIPYAKQAQFQPSYRFFIQRAYETKDVKSFFAEVVYKDDKFERSLAPQRDLRHSPGNGKRDLDSAIGAYALIEFKDGAIDWEYLTKDQIERHRSKSKQPNSMKWKDFWEEGWRITPIRVLAKRLPLKSKEMEEVVEAINRDTENDLVIPMDTIDLEPTEPRRASEPAPTQTEGPQAEAAPAQTQEQPQRTQPKAEPKAEPKPEPEQPGMFAEQKTGNGNGGEDPFLSPTDISSVWETAVGAGWKKPDVFAFLKKDYNVTQLKELRRSQLPAVLKSLETAEH